MQMPVASPSRAAGAHEDPAPTYNLFIRSTLGKGESPNYADQLQALAALKAYDEKQGDTLLRLLSRLLQYGHLNIAGVQLALQVLAVDIGKDDKALMRLVQHLVLLGLGDGSAGTPLPVPPQAAPSGLAKAVDRLGLEVLVAAWAPLGDERAAFPRKQAALRALAAVTRASLSSRPDDPTYVGGLYETLRGLLDKVDALRAGRRGLAAAISAAQAAAGQGSKKGRLADIRQRAEMWGLLRGAFSAARLALPRSGLYKVAQRSLSALSASDPVCARHALALASLLARDPAGCGSFIGAVEPLLRANVEAAARTGSLHMGILPSKRPGASGGEAGGEGEGHLNLRDTWARVYLARACAAAIQSGHIAGDVAGRGSVFWQALQLLALADPSERVALEAVRAMFGAPYPRATTAAALRQPGAGARLPGSASPADQEAEAAQSKILGASWHLVCSQALETPPVPDQPPRDPASPPPRPEDSGLFGRLARRLLRCLQSRSRGLVAGAARAVAVAAEARAWFHALSGGHGHEAEPEAVGRWMRTLQGLLMMLAGDDGAGGCEREAALEALVWCQGLDQPPTLSAGLMLRAAAHGGCTAPPIAHFTFADPWPPCLLGELLGVLARRLRCAVGLPAEAVLELAAGLAAGAPAAVPREALAALWDAAPGPLAVRSALALLSAPLPPLAQPPASAAVEVKAMAAEAEAAFHELKALAASWLGEHVNSAAGEYAWKPWEAALGAAGAGAGAGAGAASSGLRSAGPSASLPGDGAAAGARPQQRTAGGAASQGGAAPTAAPAGGGGGGGSLSSDDPCAVMAVAAVCHNPLLAAALAHLHRAVLTGAPVVRVAAAQALAKVAVRSGEPYRIQAYSALAAAAGRGLAAAAGGGGAGGGVVCWGDPLGLAPVAGPALEVLDAMYAGELVLERQVAQHGPAARGWPAPGLAALRRRHEWLLGSIAGAVCAVPRELFLPLGPRSRRLLFPDEKEEAEEAARAAAAARGPQQEQQPAEQGGEYDQQQYYDEYGQPYQYDYSTAEQYDYGDYYGSQQQQGAEAQDPYGQQHDPLARYEHSGQKAAAAVELNWGGEQAGAYDNADAALDESAVAEARPGVVLYSFVAETEEEVSVAAGASVRVLHDLGEWLQVVAPGGKTGLVPAAYVTMYDEAATDHQPNGGAGGGGGGPGSVAGGAGFGSPGGGGGGSVSRQSSIAGRYSVGLPGGGASGLQPAASYAGSNAGGAASSTAGGDYYGYQSYENGEYDASATDGAYGSYYGDYGAQYGADQYGGGAYGSSAYGGGGGGMYGDESGGAAATGRGKKGGFGGFDDFGAVLAEAKTAAVAARQQAVAAVEQQKAALLEPSAPPSDSTAAAAAADTAPAAGSYQEAAAAGGGYGGYGAEASTYGAASFDASGVEQAAAAAAPVAAAGGDGGGRGSALYEFVAEMEGELSVVAGEELELLGGEVDGWYSARVVGQPGRQGLIPASYVQLQ